MDKTEGIKTKGRADRGKIGKFGVEQKQQDQGRRGGRAVSVGRRLTRESHAVYINIYIHICIYFFKLHEAV